MSQEDAGRIQAANVSFRGSYKRLFQILTTMQAGPGGDKNFASRAQAAGDRNAAAAKMNSKDASGGVGAGASGGSGQAQEGVKK